MSESTPGRVIFVFVFVGIAMVVWIIFGASKMREYYIVYSFKSHQQTGMGRTTIMTDQPIDSMRRIQDVEKSIKEAQPEMEDLFLMSWQELRIEKR